MVVVLRRAGCALNTQRSFKESDRWNQTVLLSAPLEELTELGAARAGVLLNHK